MRGGWMRLAGTVAAVLATVATAFATEGKVRTRVYEEEASAATGRHVVTREIGEKALSSVGTTALALSFVPGVELPPANWSVAGLRLNILVGRHCDLWGVDIGGLGNELTGSLTGLQGAGLWNRIGEADAAIQTAGLVNLCERDFCGLQTAGIYNWTGEEFMGLQVGLLNRAGGLTGVQIGLYNAADHGCGLQIGLINAARALDGLQIGLANVNAESALGFFPIVNIAF